MSEMKHQNWHDEWERLSLAVQSFQLNRAWAAVEERAGDARVGEMLNYLHAAVEFRNLACSILREMTSKGILQAAEVFAAEDRYTIAEDVELPFLTPEEAAAKRQGEKWQLHQVAGDELDGVSNVGHEVEDN